MNRTNEKKAVTIGDENATIGDLIITGPTPPPDEHGNPGRWSKVVAGDVVAFDAPAPNEAA